MTDRKYFVDVMRDIISEVQAEYDPVQEDLTLRKPYYEHDHPIKLAEKLNQKDEGSFVYHKYPLICLLEDFEQTFGESLQYFYSVPCTILILDYTKQEFDSEQRYTENYKPILQPLVDLLILKMCNSDHLRIVDIDLLQYQQINRTEWGAEGIYGNNGLIFDDNLDGIQLNFPKLIVNYNNECE
jgi:hypothetical protein